MSEYIVGIDIGSSKVCAAAGKQDRLGKLQIIGATCAKCSGVKKGIVVDIDKTCDSIKDSIKQLEGMIDSSITEAYISFPGVISELVMNKGIVAVSSENREIQDNDVKRVVKACKIVTIPSDKEIIGVIPNQYIIDGYDKIKDPIGMSGLRLELDAQLVIAQSTVVNNMFKSLNNAGIKVKGVIFQPIAESEVVLNPEEIDRGVALLDIGADTSNISVFKEGNIVYNDHISLGGNAITNDIAVCLKIPFSQAEFLKNKYGFKGHDSNNNTLVQVKADFNNAIKVDLDILKQIIEARVEEILMLIDKKLKGSGIYNDITGIVIVGGGISLFQGIEEYGKSILDKPFRIGNIQYSDPNSQLYVSAAGVIHDVSSSMKSRPAAETPAPVKKKSEWVKKIVDDYDEDEDDEYEEYEKDKNNSLISKIKNFFTEFF
ncbi:MAG: cell division protein FtsA [Solirubrobacterales bacterium]